MTRRLAAPLILLILSWNARADPPDPKDPGAILMEFDLDARLVVEAAAKLRTTIQQAPNIVTVITAQEIRDRGHRTISDVLRTIPGFWGGRWEFNGWFKGTDTRGLPRTALVLLDGINIVEPVHNEVVLDRKIPLEIVKRIEVTSGPGSVLWGSNALLGIINIITHDGRSNPGLTVSAGGGHGPGEGAAARAHVSYGGSWLSDRLRLHVAATYYTTTGPNLTVDSRPIFGPLPSPSNDGLTVFIPGAATIDSAARDHFLNVAGQLGMGPVTLGFFTGYEREHREIGSGGIDLRTDYRSEPTGGEPLHSTGNDQLHTIWLRYQGRFLGQRVGLSIQAYFVAWELGEVPFALYPRSDLLVDGAVTSFQSDGIFRPGLTLDVDVRLPMHNRLLVGAELFADISRDIQLTSFDPRVGAWGTAQSCLAPFRFRPDRDPSRPCSVTEVALAGTERLIGAIYATDDWRINRYVAVNLGLRGQFSSTYNPALLASGGLVVAAAENVFVKATYNEGFRPPSFEATASSSGIASGVTFQANPRLDVERSRSVEIELNARLFEDRRPVRRWYVRADYSYTRMSGVITFPAGRFRNASDRDIHAVELLTRLSFYGGHEIWLGYHFVDVVDSEEGRLRNIANHVFNAGGRLSFFGGRLLLTTMLTLRGTMEDLNRTPNKPVPGGGPFVLDQAVFVAPTGLEVTEIPRVWLLRIGVEGRRLFGHLDVGAWVYNVLNQTWYDPDLYFDDRIVTRPQPKPGVSFFMEARVHF